MDFCRTKTVADLFGFLLVFLENSGGQFFKYVIYTFKIGNRNIFIGFVGAFKFTRSV